MNFIAVHAGPKSSSWLWGAKSSGDSSGITCWFPTWLRKGVWPWKSISFGKCRKIGKRRYRTRRRRNRRCRWFRTLLKRFMLVTCMVSGLCGIIPCCKSVSPTATPGLNSLLRGGGGGSAATKRKRQAKSAQMEMLNRLCGLLGPLLESGSGTGKPKRPKKKKKPAVPAAATQSNGVVGELLMAVKRSRPILRVWSLNLKLFKKRPRLVQKLAPRLFLRRTPKVQQTNQLRSLLPRPITNWPNTVGTLVK